MKKGRYYLFTQEEHEQIRLDHEKTAIDGFKVLWSEGKTHDEICKIMKLKKIEMALIAMDLDFLGELPYRKGGFWGGN